MFMITQISFAMPLANTESECFYLIVVSPMPSCPYWLLPNV